VFSLSRLIGFAFGEIIRLLQLFRHGRPVHPAGVCLVGRLECTATARCSGIRWLDEPGSVKVEARLSRGLGLPEGLPDIMGLALRVVEQERTIDLLLATTGFSRPGRFLVLLRRRLDRAAFGSLIPYQGTRGPVLIAARSLEPVESLPARLGDFRCALAGGEWGLGLYWATPLGGWVQFGSLQLALDPDRRDSATRFDPMLNPPPGAGVYRWTHNLRQRAYCIARRCPVSPTQAQADRKEL
jgi:hypothetical protein